MDKDFRIEIADTREKYEGLRALWCEVFKDEPAFTDSMYEALGAKPAAGIFESEEIRGYVVLGAEGNVISALTCFLSGAYEGRPVWTSYAICTKANMRGLGLAGELVEYVRDIVLESGAISLISPAEESLEEFYARHGYERNFYASEHRVAAEDEDIFEFDEEDEEYDKVEPALVMGPLDAAAYSECREAFLEGKPHVVLSDSFMKLIYNESTQPDGASGLIQINGGDAICALADHLEGSVILAELIINPRLRELSMEIDSEIARAIARQLGTDSIIYRMPGAGRCQSMAAGIEEASEAYYGFPID